MAAILRLHSQLLHSLPICIIGYVHSSLFIAPCIAPTTAFTCSRYQKRKWLYFSRQAWIRYPGPELSACDPPRRVKFPIFGGPTIYSIRAWFTKFLTPGLIRKLGNPLDDWLDWLIPTNHREGYLIRRLTRELKITKTPSHHTFSPLAD